MRYHVLIFLICLTSARAQDLQFTATQVNPPITSRGEISHRVEKILIQQARYLVSTLHPWEQNDRALLLTDGGSVEAQIRPNAHTAYGLAVLCRAAPDDAFTKD